MHFHVAETVVPAQPMDAKAQDAPQRATRYANKIQDIHAKARGASRTAKAEDAAAQTCARRQVVNALAILDVEELVHLVAETTALQ